MHVTVPVQTVVILLVGALPSVMGHSMLSPAQLLYLTLNHPNSNHLPY